MDGKIKYKESDSRADLQATLGLTVAEKFKELSCDGDSVVQLVKWTFRLMISTAGLQKKKKYKPTSLLIYYFNKHSIKTASASRELSYQVLVNY